jgi:general secretion pathway protein C
MPLSRFSRPLRKNFNWLLPPPLALVVLLCSQGIASLVGARFGLDARSLAIDASFGLPRRPPRVAPFHTTSADAILGHNPFDSAAVVLGSLPDPTDPSSPPDATDPSAAPPCEGVKVRGIVASGDAEWSFAAFAPAEGSPQSGTVLRRRGGDVGDSQVERITWDRVWMSGPRGLCQAFLFDPELPPAPARQIVPAKPEVASPGARVPAWIARGISTISPLEHDIDRGLIPRIVEQQAELFATAHVAREVVAGKPVGLRISGLGKGSLLESLGVANGDRLETLNGYAIAEPERALEAYAQLQHADRLVLQVSRGGSPVQVALNIR